MQKFERLDFENIYHIYNKGINGQDIFVESDHYHKFLLLYEKHIDPIAETYAWCLMRNHFHFLVKVKQKAGIIKVSQDQPGNSGELDSLFLSRQFSNFFNAYAQSFNSRSERTGGLFQTPFQRKRVESEDYFKALIYYIHNNPVKHGFCTRLQDYPWSSYGTVVSFTPTKMQRDKVIGWFEGLTNFVSFHNGMKEPVNISDLVMEWG